MTSCRSWGPRRGLPPARNSSKAQTINQRARSNKKPERQTPKNQRQLTEQKLTKEGATNKKRAGLQEDYILLHSVLVFDALAAHVRFDGLSSLSLVGELARVCGFEAGAWGSHATLLLTGSQKLWENPKGLWGFPLVTIGGRHNWGGVLLASGSLSCFARLVSLVPLWFLVVTVM